MSTYSHIPQHFRHTLELTDAERIRLIDTPVWIPHPTAISILDRLEWLLDLPKQTRMPCLLIIGDPNSGKTTIIEKFCKRHGIGWENDDNDPVRPIVLTHAPPSADEKSLHMCLLERFHPPYRASAPAKELRYQAVHLIGECQTRMIIFDEFHSLLAGGGKKLFEVLNAIRMFCNLGITIVGVGTGQAETVFTNDKQLTSRFGVMELEPWKRDDQFRNLLAAFEKALPLKKPSNLQKRELARLLHAHTGGNLGNVRQLLVECAKAAIRSGAERIDEALIESAAKESPWRRRSGTQGQPA